MSSTHFEWNIDEISSLNPASFEAHETQFTSTTDPDVEAKAQAAISSFFREQVIGKQKIEIMCFSPVNGYEFDWFAQICII